MNEYTSSVKVYGALLLVELIFGVWPIVAKLSLREGLSACSFVFYRCLGTSLVLVCIQFCREGRFYLPTKSLGVFGVPAQSCEKKIVAAEFALVGLLSVGNFGGYILGVDLAGSFLTSLVQPMMPVMACFFSVVIGLEPVRLLKVMGIAVSVAGSMYIVSVERRKSFEMMNLSWLGILALTSNVVCSALYHTLMKIALVSYGEVYLTMWTYIISATVFCVVSIFAVDTVPMPWTLSHLGMLGLAYAVLLTSSFNYLTIAWANKATNPSTVTVFSCLQPCVAGIAAYAAFNETQDLSLIFGGAVIICGLFLTVYGQAQQDGLRESLALVSAEKNSMTYATCNGAPSKTQPV